MVPGSSLSRCNFCSVPECKAHVHFAVDCDALDHCAPENRIKSCDDFRLAHHVPNEPVNIGSAQPAAFDLRFGGFHPGLDGIMAFTQRLVAAVVSQLRENSINLFGPEATEVIEPVPMTDIRRAIKESLPGLIASIEGDEHNVILTLARMWLTSSSGRICSKDQAAEWAIPKLAKEHATLLEKAKKAYLGDYDDKWEGMETEIIELVNYLKRSIESSLNI